MGLIADTLKKKEKKIKEPKERKVRAPKEPRAVRERAPRKTKKEKMWERMNDVPLHHEPMNINDAKKLGGAALAQANICSICEGELRTDPYQHYHTNVDGVVCCRCRSNLTDVPCPYSSVK